MTPPNQTEQEAVKHAQILRNCFEHMQTPAFRDWVHLFAADLWVRFVALKAVGFTEAQALQIVIERK